MENIEVAGNAVEEVEMGGLQEELIEEILDRIPIKHLMRMKCLSKPWCCLITRYRRSRPRASSSTLLCQYNIKKENRAQVTLFHDRERGNMHKLLGFTWDVHFELMGSANGLLLFIQFVNPHKLVIYVCDPKPDGWQWDTLPPLYDFENLNQCIYIGMGLAFDGVPNHPYKVVYYMRLYDSGCMEFQIYSSDTKEWCRYTQSVPNPGCLAEGDTYHTRALSIRTPHLFWNGMMLCVVECYGYRNPNNSMMLVYHLEKNIFELMKLPTTDVPSSLGFLFESEGCLHYCSKFTEGFCLWKFVKNNLCCKPDSWKLKHTAEIATLIAQHPKTYAPSDEKYGLWFNPCAFDEDLQIVYIQLQETIVAYSLETQEMKRVCTLEPKASYIYSIRCCSVQVNGANYCNGGDCKLLLPVAEPQGPAIRI